MTTYRARYPKLPIYARWPWEVGHLIATLEGFTDVCDRGSGAQGPTSSKGLRPDLDQLDETLREVARLARVARTRIRPRR